VIAYTIVFQTSHQAFVTARIHAARVILHVATGEYCLLRHGIAPVAMQGRTLAPRQISTAIVASLLGAVSEYRNSLGITTLP
jgi:hypothetical protein